MRRIGNWSYVAVDGQVFWSTVESKDSQTFVDPWSTWIPDDLRAKSECETSMPIAYCRIRLRYLKVDSNRVCSQLCINHNYYNLEEQAILGESWSQYERYKFHWFWNLKSPMLLCAKNLAVFSKVMMVQDTWCRSRHEFIDSRYKILIWIPDDLLLWHNQVRR